MFKIDVAAELGKVTVITEDSRGHSPEQYADWFADRMVKVAETAPEPIKLQALQFKEHAREMALFFIKRAIRSDRNTLAHQLEREGFNDTAAAIRRLNGKQIY